MLKTVKSTKFTNGFEYLHEYGVLKKMIEKKALILKKS